MIPFLSIASCFARCSIKLPAASFETLTVSFSLPIYWPLYYCLSISFFLTVYLLISFSLPICWSLCLTSELSLSFCLSINLSLSHCLSIYLFFTANLLIFLPDYRTHSCFLLICQSLSFPLYLFLTAYPLNSLLFFLPIYWLLPI